MDQSLNRRDFLRLSVMGGLGLHALTLSGMGETKKTPNVILIFTDDPPEARAPGGGAAHSNTGGPAVNSSAGRN